MAEFPCLPFWTDRYLADTTHLTTLEHGAYCLLIFSMWRAPGQRLPNDRKLLARITKLSMGQFTRIEKTLKAFFEIENNWITQRCLMNEAIFVRQKSQSQSRNAKARWLKYKELSDATALPRQSHGNAPTPTPTPTVKIVKSLNGQGEAKREAKRPPRHGKQDGHGRIYCQLGTADFEAYAKDYEAAHGEPPHHGPHGRWFKIGGEHVREIHHQAQS